MYYMELAYKILSSVTPPVAETEHGAELESVIKEKEQNLLKQLTTEQVRLYRCIEELKTAHDGIQDSADILFGMKIYRSIMAAIDNPREFLTCMNNHGTSELDYCKGVS